jgi:hypothetical protein
VAVDDGDRRLRRKRWIRGAAIALVVYLAAYAILSRWGMARSKAMGCEGWYFFVPRKDAPSRYSLHLGCVAAFSPLIVLERALGTADWPAGSEPVRSLGGGAPRQ